MATIIDALVVTLGLNAGGFRKGARDVQGDLRQTTTSAVASAKEMEARGRQAAQFFSAIKVEALSLLAIFSAGKGLKSFVTDTTASSQQLQNLAGNLQMSAGNLSAWEKTFERAGGTAADATNLFAGAASEIGKLRTGQGMGVALQALAQSGGNINEALKGPREMVIEEARVLAGLNKINPALARARAQQMGLSDAQFAIMKDGPAALEAQVAVQQRLIGLNSEQIALLAEMNRKWADFQTELEGVGGRALVALSEKAAPALDYLKEGLREMADWAAQHGDAVVGFFAALAVAVAIPMVEVLLLTAAIAAVAAGIGYLYEQWKIWIDGGQSSLGGFFQFFADTWAGIKRYFDSTIGALGQVFADYFSALKDYLKLIYLLFFGTGDQIRAAWTQLFSDIGVLWDDTVQMFKSAGPAILNAFKVGLASAFDWAKGRVKAIWDAISGGHEEVSASPEKTQPAADAKGEPQSEPESSNTKPRAPPSAKPQGARVLEAIAAAKQSESKYGVPAGVSFAQWALESNRGKSMPAASNNPFGIKAKAGQPYVEAMTNEFVNGRMVRVSQKFAKFDSIADAFDAHAKLLANGRSYAEARKHKKDPGAFADSLTGVYATDPNYGAKLKSIMASVDLSRSTSNGARGSVSRGGSTNSSEVNIQQMVIHTNAADADAMARDTQIAFSKHPMFAAQANTGLS